jgi:ribonuclease HII
MTKIIDIKKNYLKRFVFEDQLIKKGLNIIAGLDEVGRGSLAGPIVTAAVILNRNLDIPLLYDSKQLSKGAREQLFAEIINNSIDYAINVIEPDIIDKINVLQASRLSMKKGLQTLKIKPDALLIDALNIDSDIKQVNIIHGDQLSNSIAAASIIAKVTRDEIMKKYAVIYPEYDFDKNVGYGTKKHLNALKTYGITPIHRKSFKPVLNVIQNV